MDVIVPVKEWKTPHKATVPLDLGASLRHTHLSSFLHTLHVLPGLTGALQCLAGVAMVTVQELVLTFLTYRYHVVQGCVPE